MSEEFDSCLGLQVKLTRNIMELEHNKYLKSFGVTSEQGFLLKFVYEVPGCNQTQIAQETHKDKTTITRMIDTLVKKGKLKRVSSLEDRRSFKIYLTKESEKKVEEAAPMFTQYQNELQQIINKDDYKIALKVLKQIQEYYKGLNK